MAEMNHLTIPVDLELTDKGQELIHKWVAETLMDLLNDDQFLGELAKKVAESLAKQVRTAS